MDNDIGISATAPLPQTTRSGDAARWLAGISVLALATSALLAQFITDVPQAPRLLLGVTFLVCGGGALATASRALFRHDRRATVWAALVVGLLATLLMVAEFTIME